MFTVDTCPDTNMSQLINTDKHFVQHLQSTGELHVITQQEISSVNQLQEIIFQVLKYTEGTNDTNNTIDIWVFACDSI